MKRLSRRDRVLMILFAFVRRGRRSSSFIGCTGRAGETGHCKIQIWPGLKRGSAWGDRNGSAT